MTNLLIRLSIKVQASLFIPCLIRFATFLQHEAVSFGTINVVVDCSIFRLLTSLVLSFSLKAAIKY